MTKAKTSKTINASADRVWEILADFSNVKNFHPLVSKSPMLSQNNKGIGATRRCEFYDNTSVVEKVIAWQEGSYITVELSEADMPLKQATVTMSVSALTGDTSEITIEMEYVVKYGLLGKIMGIVMMRPMMKKLFNKVLNSLEHHVRTGQIIGEKGLPITA